MEIVILQKFNDVDLENWKYIVKFECLFDYKGYLCMVFESLSFNF